MTKSVIRKIYLPKRLALSAAEFHILNQQLTQQFFASVNLKAIQVLHTFLPIEKQKEVNTWMIIDRITKEYPNVRISVPRINNQTAEIESFYFEGKNQLSANTWGILEPKAGIPTPIDKIDAILVPLLACDKRGNRVGYGRGFYDKFLARCAATTEKIGLSFFDPVDQVDDVSDKDVAIDSLVIPKRFLKFRK